MKLKTGDFHTLTRRRKLSHLTQEANLIYEQAAVLIEEEADGRAFRLIGIGVSDLDSDMSADPPDLFSGLTKAR